MKRIQGDNTEEKFANSLLIRRIYNVLNSTGPKQFKHITVAVKKNSKLVKDAINTLIALNLVEEYRHTNYVTMYRVKGDKKVKPKPFNIDIEVVT